MITNRYIETLIRAGALSPAARDMDWREALEQWSEANAHDDVTREAAMRAGWRADLTTQREAMAGTAIGAALAEGWKAHDAWGSAMLEAFGVCDYMTLHGMADAIPGELDYRPSPMGPDADNVAFEALGWMPPYLLTAGALAAHLEALSGILDAAEAAGLDY